MTAVALIAGRDPRREPAGGHSSYVRAHARAAQAAGYEPHIFCVGPTAEQAPSPHGLIHRTASRLPARQLWIGAHLPPLAAALEAWAWRQGRRALFHGFGVWGSAGVCAARRLRQRGLLATAITSSYTTYGEEARSAARALADHEAAARLRQRLALVWIGLSVERFERLAYTESDAVLVNYANVERLIRRKYGLAAPCRRIAYAPESAFLAAPAAQRVAPVALRNPGSTIVAVSRHEPRKGIDVLLRALKLLADQGVAFRALLAGPGPLLDRHRDIAIRLGLENHVELLGTVDDPRTLLARADVFVLPSREEQSGSLALLEALQAGVAVVASGVDGILEDVRDGESALLVPPGDDVALAAALGRVIADRQFRERLGRAGLALFARRFSAPGFGAAIGELYAELGFEISRKVPPTGNTVTHRGR